MASAHWVSRSRLPGRWPRGRSMDGGLHEPAATTARGLLDPRTSRTGGDQRRDRRRLDRGAYATVSINCRLLVVLVVSEPSLAISIAAGRYSSQTSAVDQTHHASNW